jgi:ABC-type Fe3+-hydroxamate transport system substrate-binding protein
VDLHDDLGYPVRLAGPVSRVVSLVPSLTESVAATRPEALVAATDYCTHPGDLAVPRVRGTKNPNVAQIVELRPELVLANKEENRRRDVERMREAGIPVWVTEIETVEQAFGSLRRVFEQALGWGEPSWLTQARDAWATPPDGDPVRVAIPIWRQPWMVVGSRTFTSDLAGRLGLVNVFGDAADRYPKTTVEEIAEKTPDVVVLPDEPYRFTADDGPEAFPSLPCVLVEGRALTWYGPSLVTARDDLTLGVRQTLASWTSHPAGKHG